MDVIRVSELHRLCDDMDSVIFHESMPLEDITAKLAFAPSFRGIFVVDARGVFTGLISRIELMKWVHLNLFGGKGRR